MLRKYSTRFFLAKKAINTLLLACMIITNYKIRPLYTMLSKTRANVKIYDGQAKWMYFLIEDDDLLEKYKTVWDNVSTGIKKPGFNKSFLKTKTKSYGDEAIGFYNKKISKVGFNHTCIAVITIDSAPKKQEKHYSGVFYKRM